MPNVGVSHRLPTHRGVSHRLLTSTKRVNDLLEGASGPLHSSHSVHARFVRVLISAATGASADPPSYKQAPDLGKRYLRTPHSLTHSLTHSLRDDREMPAGVFTKSLAGGGEGSK
jgi:hypothetical protein